MGIFVLGLFHRSLAVVLFRVPGFDDSGEAGRDEEVERMGHGEFLTVVIEGELDLIGIKGPGCLRPVLLKYVEAASDTKKNSQADGRAENIGKSMLWGPLYFINKNSQQNLSLSPANQENRSTSKSRSRAQR